MLLATEKMHSGGAAGPADWAVTDYEGSIDFVLERGYTGGITVASDAYSDFGQQTSTSGGVKNNPLFKYTGRYLDPDTGLQFNTNRWYNSSLGRWMSQDPLGLGPDTDPYRYVNNSPTNGTDPTGEAMAGLTGPAAANQYWNWRHGKLPKATPADCAKAFGEGLVIGTVVVGGITGGVWAISGIGAGAAGGITLGNFGWDGATLATTASCACYQNLQNQLEQLEKVFIMHIRPVIGMR